MLSLVLLLAVSKGSVKISYYNNDYYLLLLYLKLLSLLVTDFFLK